MKHLVWIFLITLFSCSEEDDKEKIITSNDSKIITDTTINKTSPSPVERIPQEDNLAKNEQDDFLVFYQKFTASIIETNLDAVNKCIHPDGIYFIESNGALPKIQKVYDVKTFKTSKPTTFFNLEFNDIEAQPLFEFLPKLVCDEEVYDKQGCYAEVINHLKESGIWNYSGLNEKEIQAIQAAANNINLTVRNTQNFTYYFSKTEHGWKLTFMDIRTPCEA